MSSDDTKPDMPWTPWARAFGEADGLVTSFRAARPNLQSREIDPMIEQMTAVLAYVIAGEATEREIDTGDVPLATLINPRLDPMRITRNVVDAAGPAPATDDPGRTAFRTVTTLAGDRARRDEWNSLIRGAQTVVMGHFVAAMGTATSSVGPTVGQRRGQATPVAPAPQAPPSASAPTGPDALAGVMPPAIRERLGHMSAAALSLVLSFLDGDQAGVAHHAQDIATYDDRPENTGNRYAGKYPGGRFSFPVTEATRFATDILDAIHRGQNPFTYASTARGVRALITGLVPDEHQAAALAVVEKLLPADDRPLDAVPLPESDAGIAELYVAAALGAWLGGGSTDAFPAKELLRTMLVEQIRDAAATADGVPSAQRISKISDEQALAFLDDLLGRGEEAAVNRDPRRRSLIEVNLVAAAKAHLLNHPQRTPETDKVMLHAMDRVFAGEAGMKSLPGLRSDGMTETERRRAEKLAARKGPGKKKIQRR